MKNLLCCLFVVLPIVTSAEDQLSESDLDGLSIYADEDFISIATGISQPIAKAPAVASVITARDIKSLGATDIDQILETVPGLHVSRSTIYNPLYNFRGIQSDFNPQVLVLINGVPLSNLFHGDRNLIWGGMPVEAISRIEVIRGPGSALYGADAFAGVINIVTKGFSELEEPSVGARYGSYGLTDLWATGRTTVGEVQLSGILEVHKTDGSNEIVVSDAQTILDAITGTSVSNAPGQVNLKRDNVDLRLEAGLGNFKLRVGTQIRENFGEGAGAAQLLNSDNHFKSKRFNVDGTYVQKGFLPNVDIEFHASYFDTSQEVEGDFVVFPVGSTGPFLDAFGVPIFGVFPDGVIGTPEIFENHSRAGFTAQYDGIQKHDISFGSGYYHGKINKVTEEKNFGVNPTTLFPILPGDQVVDVSDTPFVFFNRRQARQYLRLYSGCMAVF